MTDRDNKILELINNNRISNLTNEIFKELNLTKASDDSEFACIIHNLKEIYNIISNGIDYKDDNYNEEDENNENDIQKLIKYAGKVNVSNKTIVTSMINILYSKNASSSMKAIIGEYGYYKKEIFSYNTKYINEQYRLNAILNDYIKFVIFGEFTKTTRQYKRILNEYRDIINDPEFINKEKIKDLNIDCLKLIVDNIIDNDDISNEYLKVYMEKTL